MKKLLFLAALFVAAAFSSCSKHNDVDFQPLAITFAEGNSLEFNVNETQTVHYTITGGSDKTVVTAELQTADDAYTVKTTPASATEGTIAITAKTPLTENCVIVTVSDGDRSITAEIAVTLNAFDGKTAVVAISGTLAELLADYDTTKITELTVIGNLNDEDIATLNNLPNLAVLDMENVNLKELPNQAFYEKTSLTSVKLPKTLKIIGNGALWNCHSLTSITIPDSVTSIGDWAFDGCSRLTSITIPDGVTSIGNSAFYKCLSLTSITIPNSVTTIGSSASSGCSSLSAFYGKFASSDNRCLIVDGCLNSFAPAGLTSYTIPNSVTSIGGHAFDTCSNLTSVTISDSVTTIGSQAFWFCRSLTSITIPDSVTEIGYGAFSDCSSLTSVTIGNSVTTIGSSAFSRCSSLTSVTIPDSVTTIGTEAFYYCSSLTSIYCKAKTPPSVKVDAFWNINTSVTLYVPTGCKAAYAAAGEWNKFTIIETEF